jgi:hypothetical protein
MRLNLLALLLLLSACGSPARESPQMLDTANPTFNSEEKVENKESIPDLYLDVDGILLVFDSLGEFDARGLSRSGDTVRYIMETNSDYARGFSIRTVSHTILSVSESFRTTMGVGSSESTCELEHWKHYESPWESLRLIHQNGLVRSRGVDIPEGAYERFPKFTREELYVAVVTYCGEDLARGLRFTDSLRRVTNDFLDYDSDIQYDYRYASTGVTDVTFRIKALSPKGDTVTRYVRLTPTFDS